MAPEIVRPAVIDRSSLGVRLIALVTLPAGFGLFVLRRPIVGIAYLIALMAPMAAARTVFTPAQITRATSTASTSFGLANCTIDMATGNSTPRKEPM